MVDSLPVGSPVAVAGGTHRAVGTLAEGTHLVEGTLPAAGSHPEADIHLGDSHLADNHLGSDLNTEKYTLRNKLHTQPFRLNSHCKKSSFLRQNILNVILLYFSPHYAFNPLTATDVYTTCLVHSLSSRNLDMSKRAYK
jgi:hypothetical protein